MEMASLEVGLFLYPRSSVSTHSISIWSTCLLRHQTQWPSVSLLARKNPTLTPRSLNIPSPFSDMYPQKPEHHLSFFLNAVNIKLLRCTHAYIELLKDKESHYKLAVFSWLVPPWVETNKKKPLEVVSLTMTKEKVRVRGKKTELVGHHHSGTVGFEPQPCKSLLGRLVSDPSPWGTERMA